jgi:RNA recognition motif. (a.k.a. RRM, RBD, or RNP domain)
VVVAVVEAESAEVAAAETAGNIITKLGGQAMPAQSFPIKGDADRGVRSAAINFPRALVRSINGGYDVPRVYVGNLAESVTRDDLTTLFSRVGKVGGALVITDKLSGVSRGFGFVEMIEVDDAINAAHFFHDTELSGRKLQVDQYRPKDEPATKGSRKRR